MTTVGNITFGPSSISGLPPRHWDSAARRYVEHDTLPQETFGEIKYWMPWAVKDDKPSGHWDYGKSVEVGAVPAANDNGMQSDHEMIHGEGVGLPLGIFGRPSTTPRADRKAAYITTFTGRFWPFDPHAADVNIEDIAHSLAMQTRYAGHGFRFYSVAEHSVHVARWCMKFGSHTALTALLHDATEAYVVDVPRPVKAHLAGYKDIEAAVWRAIACKFDLDVELPSVVHIADGRICADEMKANLHEVDPNVGPPLGVHLEFWPPGVAEIYFMDTFKKLSEAVKSEKMRVDW